MNYDHNKIEAKWQKIWKDYKLYKANDIKDNKFYLLVELTYTSGDLHMGHWFAWTAPDAFARMKRMQGENVLFPVGGFDAFGLPAENAAIKHKIHPRDWTYKNIETMRAQFEKMGPSFDWDKEVITSEPDYYSWTQWLFLQLYKKGLAYKGKVWSNWCPECKTVLANEHVVNGCCWRHTTTQVEQKLVDQWLVRITDYADKLIWPKFPKVDWPYAAVEGQNNWIGKSEGVEITFKIPDSKFEIPVFTTRPDTIYGAMFIVLAPEHPLLPEITTPDNKSNVSKYIKRSLKKLERTRIEEIKVKTGVFTGTYAINPLSKELIPIWVADFVLGSYAKGAIMGVPGHDQRDFEFAKKYDLPVKEVIEPVTGKPQKKEEFRRSIVALVKNPKTNKILSINWGKTRGGNLLIGGGLNPEENPQNAAIREIMEETGYTKVKLIASSGKIHHHYRAWSKNVDREIEAIGLFFELVSEEKRAARLEKDEKGEFKVEWISEKDADGKIKDPLHRLVFEKFIKGVVYDGGGLITNSGRWNNFKVPQDLNKIIQDLEKKGLAMRSVSYHLRDWSVSRRRYWGAPVPIIYCRHCWQNQSKDQKLVEGIDFAVLDDGEKYYIHPVAEKDLPVKLPENVDYTPTGKAPLATAEDWVEVDCPECGLPARRDSETLDTYVDSSWYFFRYPTPNYDKGPFDKEVIKKWLPIQVYFGGQEHILGHTLYARFITKFLFDQGLIKFDEFALKRIHHGVILGPDGYRMSKSRGNVVNPDDQVEKFGADSVRLYICFLGPHDKGGAWKVEGIEGAHRFLKRVWSLFSEHKDLFIQDKEQAKIILQMQHRTIQKVTEDIGKLQTHTAISAIMEYVNLLREKVVDSEQWIVNSGNSSNKSKHRTPNTVHKTQNVRYAEWDEALEVLLALLAPFAPFMAEEIYQRNFAGNSKFQIPNSKMSHKFNSIHLQPWPKYNPEFIKEETVTIAVQVNGKLRATLSLKAKSSRLKTIVIEAAKADEKIKKWLTGKEIRKSVFVPGKLINFVL